MAVGVQADMAQVNAQLTSLALQLRNTAAQVLRQHAYLNKLGHDGLMAAGFADADATAALDAINYMATVAGVYNGTVTQVTAFDFEDALTGLWAGQP